VSVTEKVVPGLLVMKIFGKGMEKEGEGKEGEKGEGEGEKR